MVLTHRDRGARATTFLQHPLKGRVRTLRACDRPALWGWRRKGDLGGVDGHGRRQPAKQRFRRGAGRRGLDTLPTDDWLHLRSEEQHRGGQIWTRGP